MILLILFQAQPPTALGTDALLAAIQSVFASFVHQVPYIVIGVVLFLFFVLGAKATSRVFREGYEELKTKYRAMDDDQTRRPYHVNVELCCLKSRAI